MEYLPSAWDLTHARILRLIPALSLPWNVFSKRGITLSFLRRLPASPCSSSRSSLILFPRMTLVSSRKVSARHGSVHLRRADRSAKLRRVHVRPSDGVFVARLFIAD